MFALMGELTLAVRDQILHRDVVLGERGKGEFLRLAVKPLFALLAGVIGAFGDFHAPTTEDCDPVGNGPRGQPEYFGGLGTDAVTFF